MLCRSKVDEFFDFLIRRRERLFDDDVLPRLERLLRIFIMHRVDEADIDKVRRILGEQLRIVRPDLRDIPLFCECFRFRATLRPREDGRQLDVWHMPERIERVMDDLSGPDD